MIESWGVRNEIRFPQPGGNFLALAADAGRVLWLVDGIGSNIEYWILNIHPVALTCQSYAIKSAGGSQHRPAIL